MIKVFVLKDEPNSYGPYFKDREVYLDSLVKLGCKIIHYSVYKADKYSMQCEIVVQRDEPFTEEELSKIGIV